MCALKNDFGHMTEDAIEKVIQKEAQQEANKAMKLNAKGSSATRGPPRMSAVMNQPRKSSVRSVRLSTMQVQQVDSGIMGSTNATSKTTPVAAAAAQTDTQKGVGGFFSSFFWAKAPPSPSKDQTLAPAPAPPDNLAAPMATRSSQTLGRKSLSSQPRKSNLMVTDGGLSRGHSPKSGGGTDLDDLAVGRNESTDSGGFGTMI